MSSIFLPPIHEVLYRDSVHGLQDGYVSGILEEHEGRAFATHITEKDVYKINSIVPAVQFLRVANAPAKFRTESFPFPEATKAFLALFSPEHAEGLHPPTVDQPKRE
ncbi:hypothetical protein ALC60_01804 [Trachymyrmex zeteki]|uniref:Uncharacterized protein n=1 Tax=Mycetomoellerius zeteki TaxID=64791 RepID=A0A151XFZ9_9HYME|nr:hypothetical protein ALC60_01804 [Trachymyrmex zeteki]